MNTWDLLAFFHKIFNMAFIFHLRYLYSLHLLKIALGPVALFSSKTIQKVGNWDISLGECGWFVMIWYAFDMSSRANNLNAMTMPVKDFSNSS